MKENILIFFTFQQAMKMMTSETMSRISKSHDRQSATFAPCTMMMAFGAGSPL